VSERRLTRALAVLALLGLAIAGYLTWVHYSDAEALCTAGGDCEKVQESEYAELAGVPVAVIGLAGYAAILGSLALRGEAGRLATVALALIGFGFSGYLTWAEVFEIEAICQWCVGSAVVMTAIVVLATLRMLRAGP
jgi:uncharacterized membrane protein